MGYGIPKKLSENWAKPWLSEMFLDNRSVWVACSLVHPYLEDGPPLNNWLVKAVTSHLQL